MFTPSDFLAPSPYDPSKVVVQGASVDSKGDAFEFDINQARFGSIYDTIVLASGALPTAGPSVQFLGSRTGKGLVGTNRDSDDFLSKTQDMVIIGIGIEIVLARGGSFITDTDYKAIRDAGAFVVRYNQNTLWYNGLLSQLPSPYSINGMSVSTDATSYSQGDWQPFLVPKVFHGNCDTLATQLTFPSPSAAGSIDPTSTWAARTLTADRWIRFHAFGFIIDN